MKPQSVTILLASAGSALGAAVCRAKVPTSTVGSSSTMPSATPSTDVTPNILGSPSSSSSSAPAVSISAVSVIAAASSSLSASAKATSVQTSTAATTASPAASGNCPAVHVIGARETTASPGFGTALNVVNGITSAFSGATSEAITYPAAGGNSYASSVTAGIKAVISQVEAFNAKCPESVIVMVGYSQGSQIMDDAFCGGPDGTSMAAGAATVSSKTAEKVAALIFMGDPRAIGGLPYQVGTATQGGFAARPAGFTCPTFSDRIQSYCDKEDPFCSKGNDAQHHQQYATIYGSQALMFVKGKVNAALGN